MTASLSVSQLTKSYPTPGDSLVVLENVDLQVDPGDSVAITGPSGCGKSTLLHILGTLEPPTSGSVKVDGDDPFALRPDELAEFRNHRIGFVFQDHHLLPQCSVLENVLVPTIVDSQRAADVEKRALDLLQVVGLTSRLDHRPAELSGGERQRVAIARALIQKPHLLLCDEPTGNLDPRSAETIADLFLDLHKEEKNILIVVTHSSSLAARFGKHLELVDRRLSERNGS